MALPGTLAPGRSLVWRGCVDVTRANRFGHSETKALNFFNEFLRNNKAHGQDSSLLNDYQTGAMYLAT